MNKSPETGHVAAEMPRYVSHKRVHALEIAAIGEPMSGSEARSIAFKEPGFQGKTLPAEMFSRYKPVIGDFYVVYADGYESFSPRKAFVEGYKREVE